ncbi:MAG: MarC family protein [Candidatus Bathyarchaeia archaeon]
MIEPSWAIQAEGLLRATVALFVIVDPLGNMPIFMGLTRDMDRGERRRAFRDAALSGLALLLFFALCGELVLWLFSVSLSSFKIAGGALLLIIAVRLLVHGEWRGGQGAKGSAIVPFGFPLMVGPGAITATMVSIRAYGVPAACLSALMVFSAALLIYRFVERIYGALGESGSAIVANVMAIFTAAIAVQFILDGISAHISGLWA